MPDFDFSDDPPAPQERRHSHRHEHRMKGSFGTGFGLGFGGCAGVLFFVVLLVAGAIWLITAALDKGKKMKVQVQIQAPTQTEDPSPAVKQTIKKIITKKLGEWARIGNVSIRVDDCSLRGEPAYMWVTITIKNNSETNQNFLLKSARSGTGTPQSFARL